MTLAIGNPSSPATGPQLLQIAADLGLDPPSLREKSVLSHRTIPGLGAPIVPFKYSGALIDFVATDVNGGAHAFTFSSVPSDAVALELSVAGAGGYVFFRLLGGLLSNTGVLATNNTANLASARWAAAGSRVIIPLAAVGAVPSTLRFAFDVAANARLNGRYISQASNFPYLTASTTEFVLTGAGASQQLPYTNPTSFPVGYTAVVLQVNGTTPARFTIDGTSPTANSGDLLPAGTYILDVVRHGIALSALRIFLPTGTNVVGNSLIG